jgi:copper chaperone CopZ
MLTPLLSTIDNYFVNVLTLYDNKTMERALFKGVGMYCSDCKPIVEKQLEHEKGVKTIDVDYMTDSVIIDYDPLLITKEEVKNELGKSGFKFVRVAR